MKTKQSHFISYVSYSESVSPDYGVPEDAGVAKERQIGHVLGAVELGGVDLAVIQSFEDIWNIHKGTHQTVSALYVLISPLTLTDSFLPAEKVSYLMSSSEIPSK